MIKKMYHISGFDCPNCAAKTEAYLSKQKEISYCRLDFAGNRLYITYKNNPYSLDELKNKIKEVEDDPLDIFESSSGYKSKNKIFDKKMWFLLGRIIFALIIAVLCMFVIKDDKYIWLRFILYCLATVVMLYDLFFKVILHIKHKENILDHFLLISIASLGAIGLGIFQNVTESDETHVLWGVLAHDEVMEGLMVCTLFQIGRIIENVATSKSKSAVMAAVEVRVDEANLITEDGVKKVKPENLKVDDVVIVTTGEAIPTDGVVIDGNATIDTSSLTGEYMPISATIGNEVFSGTIIKSGSIKLKVNKLYQDSTVAKILDLIASGGEKKSKADEFIAKFAKFYTPIVVIIAIITLLVKGFVTSNWPDAIKTGLEILVIGCPCAIVISVPLAYFSAIGLASKNGIVIKGTNYLDELSRLGKLITDKTGTLTHGSFAIRSVHPVGVNEDVLLNTIYKSEALSTHPIAKAICHGQNLKKTASEIKDFIEIPGLGVICNHKKDHIVTGGYKLLEKYGIKCDDVIENGVIIHSSINNKYIGYIVLSDEIKKDAQPMVNLLHHEGVKIILLTGDKEENAKDICLKLGIDKWHSELLPENKTTILEQEMENYPYSVAFIGDGINDAPSIIRSDIGIAMGGIGSDIAVENADIVIMNDDPAKVYDAMMIAKKARRTSIFNIVFALIVKVSVAVLAIVIKDLPMWVAVIADTGLTILLVLNSLLLLYRKVRRKKINKKQ